MIAELLAVLEIDICPPELSRLVQAASNGGEEDLFCHMHAIDMEHIVVCLQEQWHTLAQAELSIAL